MKNFFDLSDQSCSAEGPELFETILSGPDGLRVERIVSWGQVTPPGQWYDQPDDEWVMVLEGEARLAWDDGREVTLTKGDQLFLPAHKRHRVTHTSRPCLWLAVRGQQLVPTASSRANQGLAVSGCSR